MSRTIAPQDLSSFRLDGLTRYPFEASAFIEAGVVHASDQESVLRSSAYIARSRRVRSWPDDPAPTKNYVGHKADLAHHAVLLPEGASERFLDPETLWNEIESTNVTRDRRTRRLRFKQRTRTAETLIADLPVCAAMSERRQIDLAVSFALERFVEHGAAVELAVHRYRDPLLRSKLEQIDERGEATWTHSYMRRFNPPIYDIPSREALPQTPPTTGPHALRFVEDGAEYIIPYGPHVHMLRSLQPIRGEKIGKKTELRLLDPPFASTRQERLENRGREWRGINTRGAEPELFTAWRRHQEAYFRDNALAISIMPPFGVPRGRTKSRRRLSGKCSREQDVLVSAIERSGGTLDLHSLAALAAAAGAAADMQAIIKQLESRRDVVILGSGLVLSARNPGAAEHASKTISKVAQHYLERHGRAEQPTPWSVFETAVANAEADSDDPWPDELLAASLTKSIQTEARVLASDVPPEVRRHAELSLALLKVVRSARAAGLDQLSTADRPQPPPMPKKATMQGQSNEQRATAGGTDIEKAVAREMQRSRSGFDRSDIEPPIHRAPKRGEILVRLNGRETRRRINDPIFTQCSNVELAAMLDNARDEARYDPFRGADHERAYRALSKVAAMRGMNPESPSTVKVDTDLYEPELGKRFIDFKSMKMKGGLPAPPPGRIDQRGRQRDLER